MSSERETLDQLLGGDMSLATIREAIYSDDRAFLDGVYGLLNSGDVRLMRGGITIPEWQQRTLFLDRTILQQLNQFQLMLTDQGARRIS